MNKTTTTLPPKRLDKVLADMNFLAALYIVFWCGNVPLSISSEARALAIISAAAWIYTTWLLTPGYFFKPTVSRAVLLIWLAFIFSSTGLQNVSLTWLFPVFIFFLLYLISDYYLTEYPQKLKYFLWVILLTITYFTIKTLQGYQDVPQASRLLSHASEETEYLLQKGIGGYGLVYTVVLLIPCLLFVIKHDIFGNIYVKICLTAILFLSLLLVVNAGYFIAFLSTLTFPWIVILYNRVSPRRMYVIFLIIVTVVFVIPKGFYSEALKEFSASIDNPFIARRLDDLAISLEESRLSGTTSLRLSHYQENLEAIEDDPFAGKIGAGSGHSQVLLLMAQYGVFTGLVFALICISFMTSILFYGKDYGEVSVTPLAFAMVSQFVFTIMVNTVAYSMGLVAFVTAAAIKIYMNQNAPDRPAADPVRKKVLPVPFRKNLEQPELDHHSSP